MNAIRDSKVLLDMEILEQVVLVSQICYRCLVVGYNKDMSWAGLYARGPVNLPFMLSHENLLF